MSTKKLTKGCLVRLDPKKCFTKRQGGELQYPLTNYANDEHGTVESRRPVTPEETTAWYESDASKGMTSDGESKLPPQSRYIPIYRDRVYTVLRSRAAVRLGWGNKTGGMTKIMCTETGEETYIKRHLLEVIS
jgi:hypothetical protein|tara:strand:+ start:107 stop:505 length:399 start_codon:yes stop_codon:yes gene_type:complete